MGCVFSFFCGCCSHNTKHDPQGPHLVSSRSCTDKLMLLLYIVSCALFVGLIVWASRKGGDPDKILKGIDLNGSICGVSSGVRSKPLAALPGLDSSLTVWICVDSCAHTSDVTANDMSFLHVSQELWGYCLPTFNASGSVSGSARFNSQFDAQFEALQQMISRGISDLYNSWPIILASTFFALVFSYVFMFLSRRFAGVMIWFCILMCIVAGFFISYSFLKAANTDDTEVSQDRITVYKWCGYLFLAITSLFCLIILAMSNQIRLAIEVVKEGSHAINDMKFLPFFPIVPLIIMFAYLAAWIFGALYIFSVSNPSAQSTPSGLLSYGYGYPSGQRGQPNTLPSQMIVYEIDSDFRPYSAYHCFHLLWTAQFLIYFCYMVLAGAVANWYFTERDASGNKRAGGDGGYGRFPVAAACYRTIRYHLGSVAFASLIIAIVQAIRLAIKYVEMKTRTNPPSHLQKAIFCILKCFLKCAECCLDRISKNALIWTAMWGDPFLTACCSSFSLIWRNLARVAAINVVSSVILLIGKLSIAGMTTGFCALILINVEPYKTKVSSPYVPCLFIAIIAYALACLFFVTFHSVIDTTFLCFLVDCENHEKNKDEAMFASEGLQKLVTKYHRRSAKEAAAHQQAAEQLKQKLSGEQVAPDDEQFDDKAHASTAHANQRNVKDTSAQPIDSNARTGKQAW